MYSQAALAAGTQAHYTDALYYDHVYKHRRKDVAFYVEFASQHGGPVLELGCGTGRVTLALAQGGIEVNGIDLMPSMLAQARLRLQRLPPAKRRLARLQEGDLFTVRLRKKFPLVISPFHVFMHIYTRNEMERALASVKRHLAPNGRFVFDVLLPDLHLLTRNPLREYKLRPVRHPREKITYDYYESFEYDAVGQVQWIHMRFDPRQHGAAQFTTPLAHSQWYPRELESVLHYNGFDIVDRYGDFDKSPLSSESLSQIVVAKLRA